MRLVLECLVLLFGVLAMACAAGALGALPAGAAVVSGGLGALALGLGFWLTARPRDRHKPTQRRSGTPPSTGRAKAMLARLPDGRFRLVAGENIARILSTPDGTITLAVARPAPDALTCRCTTPVVFFNTLHRARQSVTIKLAQTGPAAIELELG